MGRKAGTEEKATQDKTTEAETEDTPVVQELKALDDKYLAVEQELEKEIAKLRSQYRPKFEQVYAERRQILDAPPSNEPRSNDADANLATVACKGFWLPALKKLPSTQDEIEPHDEEVLEYLNDVRTADLDPEDEMKGFKVEFEFAKNPFFTNDVLTVEFQAKESNPYAKEMTCTEIKSSTIDWKPGKDVTVEKVGKKVKGVGAKKQKQKQKESVEPRDSFFRGTFRNLKIGDDIPDDINMEDMMDEIDDMEEFVEQYIDNQMEIFRMVKENLVPHAVRVYTGEAFPDEDDDEESEEEDDDDDSEEDTDDSPPAKKGGTQKKAAAKGNMSSKDKEECKQQ
jgi:nucleosome assembly protein 1-like 1